MCLRNENFHTRKLMHKFEKLKPKNKNCPLMRIIKQHSLNQLFLRILIVFYSFWEIKLYDPLRLKLTNKIFALQPHTTVLLSKILVSSIRNLKLWNLRVFSIYFNLTFRLSNLNVLPENYSGQQSVVTIFEEIEL